MGRDAEVVVVGGGSTGCGVARDLAMRGVDVTLVERGRVTDGTTGRMHGLLHSGARYAVSDRESARECVRENEILREIASHCVEDTGGLFVKRPEDPADYFAEKLRGCDACDIPARELTAREARAVEPHLARDVERAIEVPDAAVDPFRLCVANVLAAERLGARVETHAEVVDVMREGGDVTGVRVRHPDGPGSGPASKFESGPTGAGRSTSGRTEEITAEYVVNATGAWAGQLAAMADLSVAVRPSKGAMVVTNVRQLDTVVNRCRPKGDADIVVPHETTAILGTTDVEVDDPDAYAEERREVDRLIDDLADLVPLLADARTIRSFWGVRPLYEPPETATADPTDVTRQFFLLDHETRDGVAGMVSVVGGKFTTYRLMAERIADHVCSKLGVSGRCRTAEVPLPGSEDPTALDAAMDDYGLRSPVARRSRDRLGSRAPDVLDDADPNPVLCSCEAVTCAEVQDAIEQTGPDLNGVRIRTRASMGTCQGCFCARELAHELHPTHDAATARAALAALYRERWKGQRHACWGEQLAQAALTYALHAASLNRDRAPAAGSRALDADDFAAFDAGPSGGDGRGD